MSREESRPWPGGEDSYDGAVAPQAIEAKPAFGQIKPGERPYWSGRPGEKEPRRALPSRAAGRSGRHIHGTGTLPSRHLSASSPTRQGVTSCTISASTPVSAAELPQRRDFGGQVAKLGKTTTCLPGRPHPSRRVDEKWEVGPRSGHEIGAAHEVRAIPCPAVPGGAIMVSRMNAVTPTAVAPAAAKMICQVSDGMITFTMPRVA